MEVYYDFPSASHTSIAVGHYSGTEDVPPHMHTFQEFVLIRKGACIHTFRNIQVPLISGDVFLIPPMEEHSFSMNSNVSIMNCYFFPDRMGPHWKQIMKEAAPDSPIPANIIEIQSQWDSLLAASSLCEDDLPCTDTKRPKTDMQNIIHLSPKEQEYTETMMLQIDDEQSGGRIGTEYMKSALLQIILLTIKRAQHRQNKYYPEHSLSRRQLIIDAVTYFEDHYAERIDLKQVASLSAMSDSYFRFIFKDVTGLPPLEYLNRIRIIKSLEYLQVQDLSISEAAALVGIFDSNYFSRIFKKIMGYPPSYFKNIH